MNRTNISSGAPWESIVGYSRAVKVGNTIEIAGTTAMDNDKVVAPGNLYLQAKFILEKIEQILKEAGAELKDVVRTRMYVTNIDEWEQAGKAHGEFFRGINPVATMVEVSRLISPELVIEIEVTAITTE